MPLRNHIDANEDIVARVGPFYATSRRVLRFETASDGQEYLSELPYARVNAVDMVRPPNHRMMAGGTALAIGGVVLSVGFGLLFPTLAIPAGVAMIVLGGMGTGQAPYFQLQTGATGRELALWRIPYAGSMDFIAAVGYRTGKRITEHN